MFLKLPKFGKIKMNGAWCDFHESNVITGTISDDYCKFKIEEFEPKMNKYIITAARLKNPTLETMSKYGLEIKTKSHSLSDCIILYLKLLNFTQKYVQGYAEGFILDEDTLRLYKFDYQYEVGTGFPVVSYVEIDKLEKPVMKTYKIIPNQNKHPDSITYEFMNSYFTVQSDSPVNAFRKYCERDSFVINSDLNFGYVFDTESLDLYYASWSINEQLGNSSFVKKLEKPVEINDVPNMKYKYKIIPNRYNSTPSYDEMMRSDILIDATGPKTALNRYRHLFDSRVELGWTLNLESLDLHQVIFDGQREYIAHFIKKLEKPMVKLKLNNLSFKTLTEANNKRLPLFKNSKGLPAHSKPDGSDWSHAEWLQAVIGELGEYANIMKKVQRGDLTMEEAKPSIEKELADVMTYFAILAQQLNIDLGQAVEDKFNEVSDRVKANVYINNDKVVSNYEVKSKQELCDELTKIKEKQKRINTNAKQNFLKAEGYHKPMSFNSAQIANMVVGAMAGYLMNPLYYHKPQMKIQLQDLGNGKVYSKTKECEKRTFSMLGPAHLKEMGSEIVKGTLTKILLNGKEYEPKNVVKVGDLIQFSDERNILYSLRITELIVS